MVEPAETEPKELDRFVSAMKEIAEDSKSDPEKLKNAPAATAIRRLDEVRASREPILSLMMYHRAR